MKPTPVEQRFWQHVFPEPMSGCWLWDGCVDHGGYGRISLGGRRGRVTGAHRLSWQIHNGPISDDIVVCHHCDLPSCVNPNHLFIGTQADNIRDMLRKDRWRSGAHKLRGRPRAGRIFNAEKTHCRHGHPLSGDNIHINQKGWRICRACWRRRSRITRDRAGRLSLREDS